jgi:aspartate/methionine/tyrosine aminotransferase
VLIERIGVNGVPGHMFHERAEGVRTLRFHFAVRDDVLDDACRRLASLRT